MNDGRGDKIFGIRSVAMFVAIAALMAAVVLPSAPGRAQTDQAFVVSGVGVDVTAETAAAARKIALAEGESRAFERLLARLTLRADRRRLPEFTGPEIAEFIREFSVDTEKTSPVRYLATLTYGFKPADIRRLLRDFGIPFAVTPSKPVLVLAVYRAAGALALWDEPNPWRAAWAGRPELDGLVPLVLPAGDLTDIAAIGAEQAAGSDDRSLGVIARRYKTDTTLVALAELGASRQGLPLINVSATRRGAGRPAQTIIANFAAARGESIADLLARAAGEIALRVEDQWKADNLLRFDDVAVLPVALTIGGLGDWVAIKKRLVEVAVISRTDLVLMSRGEVRINLHFFGGLRQLSLALAQVDLALNEIDGAWTLERIGNKRQQPRPPRPQTP